MRRRNKICYSIIIFLYNNCVQCDQRIIFPGSNFENSKEEESRIIFPDDSVLKDIGNTEVTSIIIQNYSTLLFDYQSIKIASLQLGKLALAKTSIFVSKFCMTFHKISFSHKSVSSIPEVLQSKFVALKKWISVGSAFPGMMD